MHIEINMVLSDTWVIVEQIQHDGVKFNRTNIVWRVEESEDKLDLYDDHIKYTIGKK